MIVLRADSAALQAHAMKKRREAVPVVTLCVVIGVAIVLIDYRVMLLSLIALSISIVPFVEWLRARRTARRYSLVELECSDTSISLRTDGFAWPLAFDDLTAGVVNAGAMVLVIKRGKKFERWAIPASAEALAAAEQALTRLGVPVRHEKFGAAQTAAILGGVVAFYLVSFAAGGLVLFGLIHIVLALTGRDGSLLTGAGLIFGALVLFVGIALVPRLAR